MEQHDIHYLAGIIDGEGCFAAYWDKQGTRGKQRDGLRIRISVANTDLKLINWLKTNYGGYTHTRKNMSSKKWKTGHQWILGMNRESGPFLESLIPILIVKKEQAKLFLWFVNTLSTQGYKITPILKKKRKEMYLAIKTLNRKGPGSDND